MPKISENHQQAASNFWTHPFATQKKNKFLELDLGEAYPLMVQKSGKLTSWGNGSWNPIL